MTKDLIFGLTWEQIQKAQRREAFRDRINVNAPGDYGCDPTGDGLFRMVPSGDVVSFEEMKARLEKGIA